MKILLVVFFAVLSGCSLAEPGACDSCTDGGSDTLPAVSDTGIVVCDDPNHLLGKSCGNSVGECRPGTYVCVDRKLICDGFGYVPPSVELCNGKDDDCDGAVDNGFPDLNKACEAGVGACKRSGHYVCNGDGSGTVCNVIAGGAGTEGPPGYASCKDGVDNDCDGLSDLDDPKCRNCSVDNDCAATSPCMDYYCSTQKVCVETPKSDGIVCDDGLGGFCGGIQTCKSGACSAGVPTDCNDGNVCTADSCSDTLSQCVHTAVPNCCKSDADCAPISGAGQCVIATCNLLTNQCQAANKPNGTSCENGFYCDGQETCQSGVCTPGTAVTCTSTNPCLQGTCNESARQCIFSQISGCGCASATDCDDNNECTVDACSEGLCQHTAKAVGSSCVDGPCTDNGKCVQQGASVVCVATPRDCSVFADACNTAYCDASSDSCKKTPKQNGTSCDSGFYCDGQETCQSGVCTPGTAVACNNGQQCLQGSCSEAQKQCVFTAVPNCCTSDSQCTIAGNTNPCLQGTCNLAANQCQTSYKTNGTYCVSGIYCAGQETCQNGTCTCYNTCPNGCDDGNPCTTDTCVGGACQHTPVGNGTSCDDGQWCTIGDYCSNGYCVSGPQRNCSPGTCNESMDSCVNQTNGPGCSDGTREGFTDSDKYPNIAGCSGGWSIAGLAIYQSGTPASGCNSSGNSSSNPNGYNCNAANLCAYGWHICTGRQDVVDHLLYGQNCQDAWAGSEKRFFATRQGSNGNGICNASWSVGNNDIFGCGNFGDPPASDGLCGVLNVFGSEDCLAIAKIPGTSTLIWDCDATGDTQNELELVVKLGPDLGGVLCCKN